MSVEQVNIYRCDACQYKIHDNTAIRTVLLGTVADGKALNNATVWGTQHYHVECLRQKQDVGWREIG